MPFAPIVPKNLGHSCFVGWSEDHINARYMTQTYKCTDEFARTSPAVVHIDKTARPQIVDENEDPFMFDLLNAWHNSNGCPSLINTSFNNHGEPIVEQLEDGLQNLIDGRVDVLIVQDRWVIEHE